VASLSSSIVVEVPGDGVVVCGGTMTPPLEPDASPGRGSEPDDGGGAEDNLAEALRPPLRAQLRNDPERASASRAHAMTDASALLMPDEAEGRDAATRRENQVDARRSAFVTSLPHARLVLRHDE
jgi:hypothetical protein